MSDRYRTVDAGPWRQTPSGTWLPPMQMLVENPHHPENIERRRRICSPAANLAAALALAENRSATGGSLRQATDQEDSP